jgi:hypothetical protein
MKRLLPLAFLLAAGCDPAPSDYPTVEQARSTAAEWAKVNALAAQGKLTSTYSVGMRAEARNQLTKAQSAFPDPTSPQAREVRSLLAMPDDAPAAELAAHADTLKKLEDALAVS